MKKIEREIQRVEKQINDWLYQPDCYVSSNKVQRLTILRQKESVSTRYQNPVLATLTFRNEPSIEVVSTRFYIFINELSKSVFRNAYRRYAKRVKCSALCEKDDQTRLHIHAVFNRPEFIAEKDFKNRIEKFWTFGYVKFQDPTEYHTTNPSDYLSYMCKEKTKDLRNHNFSEYYIQ